MKAIVVLAIVLYIIGTLGLAEARWWKRGVIPSTGEQPTQGNFGTQSTTEDTSQKSGSAQTAQPADEAQTTQEGAPAGEAMPKEDMHKGNASDLDQSKGNLQPAESSSETGEEKNQTEISQGGSEEQADLGQSNESGMKQGNTPPSTAGQMVGGTGAAQSESGTSAGQSAAPISKGEKAGLGPQGAEGYRLIRTHPNPLDDIDLYLVSWKHLTTDLCQQIEVHQYCSRFGNIYQCIAFDGNETDSRMIGISYIAPRSIVEGFTIDERRLWHSLQYEVKAGHLVAPWTAPDNERFLMQNLANMYEKFWLTWNVLNTTNNTFGVPIGVPQLLVSWTEKGQENPDIVAERNDRLGIDRNVLIENRRDIVELPILRGVDSWARGITPELVVEYPCTDMDIHWGDCLGRSRAASQ